MAASALPDLRAQLDEAQRILRTAGTTPNGSPSSTGSVTDPKTRSD
ncbi:hypothetical protein [Microvirga thermotolerans]|nr:hypothetical protein [Microvirga thermotolerans]